MDLGPAHFHEFGFDALFFEFLQHVAQQNGGVAAFAGAPIERYNLNPFGIHECNLLPLFF